MAFFSVIIPLYNKQDFIEETLRSVLNQTFKDFELIIINDGSTDESFEIVKTIEDERIRIINQENHGLCASRNAGIKNSKSKYIAFLDADDLWMEDFLATIYQLISFNYDHSVFATNVKLLHKHEKPILNSKPFNNKHEKLITNFFSLGKNILGPSSLVIKKSVFEQVGYFDELVNYGEEDDFYIRCFSAYNLKYYSDFKTYYRTGIQNQLTAPNKSFKRKIPDYEKYLKTINTPELKKFLDFVHFRLVVLFKMERNYKLVKFYSKKINVINLTGIQKIKYYMPTDLFYIVKRIYIWFSKKALHS